MITTNICKKMKKNVFQFFRFLPSKSPIGAKIGQNTHTRKSAPIEFLTNGKCSFSVGFENYPKSFWNIITTNICKKMKKTHFSNFTFLPQKSQNMILRGVKSAPIEFLENGKCSFSISFESYPKPSRNMK